MFFGTHAQPSRTLENLFGLEKYNTTPRFLYKIYQATGFRITMSNHQLHKNRPPLK